MTIWLVGCPDRREVTVGSPGCSPVDGYRERVAPDQEHPTRVVRFTAPEPVATTAPRLRGPVIMTQDWRDVTFVHWAVAPERLQTYLPPGVRPDAFEGLSYVGLVPFRMVDAGLGQWRRVPWAGTFLETNVRLYSVDSTGRRGIVFLSLDCNRSVVVAGARTIFGLPYRWAEMSHAATTSERGEEHVYDARLRWPGVCAESHLAVRVGRERASSPLDDFLTARWGLHTRRVGRTFYIPNAHLRWPLREAEIISLDDELVGSVGLGDLMGRPPDHVAFSRGVHTTFGLPARADKARVRDVR